MLFVVKRAATAEPACGDLLILESDISWFLRSSKNCVYLAQALHIDKSVDVSSGPRHRFQSDGCPHSNGLASPS